MDYGYIIKRSWRITWKYKFLWLFGLFAASYSFNYNIGNPFPENKTKINPPKDLIKTMENIIKWADSHLNILIIIGLTILILTILMIILSIICEGALIGLTEKIEAGSEEINLSAGWKIGKRCFFRIFKLYLITFLLVILVIVIPAILITFFIATNRLGEINNNAFIPIIIALFTIGLFAILIPLGILIGIIFNYASRFIVIKDYKSIDSVRHGWKLLRSNFVKSILLILINIALGIMAIIGFLIPFGIIGATGIVLFMILGKSALAVKIFFVLFMVAILFVLSAFIKSITATFFSSYWTLAFMELTKEPSSSVFSD
ncbi:MAG: hypothetical protein HY776_03395 [Actinobacteria bacterium]|nr:hypothetical protein [Actinomycetota bacterium]